MQIYMPVAPRGLNFVQRFISTQLKIAGLAWLEIVKICKFISSVHSSISGYSTYFTLDAIFALKFIDTISSNIQ